MTSFRALAAGAASSLLVVAACYAASPFALPSAQDRAEATCQHQRVQPGSPTWELCLSHVTRAYQWGEPALAQQLAKAASGAPEACRDEGYDTGSSGFRACVNREIDAQSQLMILGDDTTGDNVAQAL